MCKTNKLNILDYVWIDGTYPTKKLRKKTKITDGTILNINNIPIWSADGSSTYQQNNSDNSTDILLHPVCYVNNPLRNNITNNYIVLCETFNTDNTPHSSNTRAILRKTLEQGGSNLYSWWGFEQEYVLMKDGKIMGWPRNGFPPPQGPYYCGIGADEVIGRNIIEKHFEASINAGLLIGGNNAEVMLGQWEFQIGYRGIKNDPIPSPLLVSDHLWLARYLLYLIGEEFGVYATLDPKPRKGNWNGSGNHMNFSTSAMRNNLVGPNYFKKIVLALQKNHQKHMEVYGANNNMRMTGQHETSSFEEFTWDQSINNLVGNRSTSVRIPPLTYKNWQGYLEDRRPAANVDPYEACNVMIQTLMSV